MFNLYILNDILIYVGENEKEILYKCPLHEDHNDHPKKGHFYVEKTTGKFICFKCNVSGNNIFKFIIFNRDKLINIKNVDRINQLLLNIFNNQQFLFSVLDSNDININHNIIADIETMKYQTIMHTHLIEELTKVTMNKKYYVKIVNHLKEERKIDNQRFIRELIESKKILYFIPTFKIKELVKNVYGKRLNREGFFINFKQFDNMTLNAQIRFLDKDNEQKLRYFSLIKTSPNGVIISNEIDKKFTFVVFLVEGVFDAIKLHYLLQSQNVNTNYLILAMLGKTNYKSFELLKNFCLRENLRISVLFILLDNDVNKHDITKIYKYFNKYFEIRDDKTFVRLFKSDEKDLDKMERINFTFVEYPKYITDLYKLLNY